MPIIKTTPSYTPKCPNHGATLEGCGFPLPQQGIGKCPISGADFAFSATVDQEKMSIDKNGNPTKTPGWKIEGSGVEE